MKKFFKKPYEYIKKTFGKHGLRNILLFFVSCGVLIVGITLIWVSTFKIPSIQAIEERKISLSTKIYDSTGKILLYDVFQDTKRTIVPLEEISKNVQEATLSIEDKDFYTHKGIKPLSILRAVLINIQSLFMNIGSFSYGPGGSTVTQQVVKNSILTGDKTPARKLKELVLSLKLEKMLSKEDILSMYLNEIPYGGTLYGVEEASQAFFGKPSKDVTLAEAAYLAALPQAPSFYSPYGKNKARLDERKNLVLREMLEDGKIDEETYNTAKAEVVEFLPRSSTGIKAPHFVMYVIEQLEKKYGEEVIQQGGLRVITTLNYELQAKAEATAKKFGDINTVSFKGTNDAFVAIDPKTGDILTMVGSRDYFDTAIDGNFNVTTAHRQPGSTFKPFAYAQAFIKGYTPETVLFDLPTQFSTRCTADNTTSITPCYSPGNYDDKFRGPMTIREALAQSINVPAVKALYLAGVTETINLAENMGVGSLGSAGTYGLTLVLGGGEVSLLDMTSAYGVFANEGVRNPHNSILKVTDKNGNILEEASPKPIQIFDANVARSISSILTDNVARTPLYGANSTLYFGGRDVAVKTGTTNDYKDAWIIGYTPSIVVGTWAGNNDNTPMERKVSGLIVAPMWREFMNEVLKVVPNEEFVNPTDENSYALKPVLRGKWQGGISNLTEVSNNDPEVPYNSIQEVLSGGVHSILYWAQRNDPRGAPPSDPRQDSQFELWEYPIRVWATANGYE